MKSLETSCVENVPKTLANTMSHMGFGIMNRCQIIALSVCGRPRLDIIVPLIWVDLGFGGSVGKCTVAVILRGMV